MNSSARPHKQSMSELKYRRLTEHNARLREDLERPRIPVSEASASLIRYCKSTRDYLVPSVWGPVDKREDPYAPTGGGCDCSIIAPISLTTTENNDQDEEELFRRPAKRARTELASSAAATAGSSSFRSATPRTTSSTTSASLSSPRAPQSDLDLVPVPSSPLLRSSSSTTHRVSEMSNILGGGASSSSNGHEGVNGLARKGSSSGSGSVGGTPRSRRAAGRAAVGLSNGHHVIDRLNGSGGDMDSSRSEDGDLALTLAEERYSSSNFKPLYEGSTIDRREFLRLTLQSLRDLGLNASAQALERETRMTLEHPSISAFRKAVTNGEWKHVERLLMDGLTSAAKRQAARLEGKENGLINGTNGSSSSSRAPPSVDTVLREPETHNLDWIRFLLYQQRYLELLEAKRTKKALSVLRERITPLEHGSERLHQLSSLVMCASPDELRRRANWSGTLGGSRQTLLDEIEKVVQPNIMVPSRRLPELLEQAQEWQRQQDPYSNAPSRGLFSLYADHASDRSSFPTYSSDADVLDAHSDEVWKLSFSSDGRKLVTAGKDRKITIWNVPADVDEGKPITLEKKFTHTDAIRCIDWSPDGRSLLTASENDVVLWNVESGATKTIIEGVYVGGTVAWLPDGKSLVTGGMGGDVSIWNVEGKRLHSWKINRVVALAVSPDGKRLVVVDWRAMPAYPATGRPSSSSRSRAAAYPTGTSGSSNTPSTSIFAGSFNPLSPRTWAYGRLGDGEASTSAAPTSARPLVAVDLGGGSRTLTNEQQAIHFFDLPNRKELGCIYMPDRLVSVSISSDSRYALLNKKPNEAQLWDIEAQSLVSKYVGHPIEENLIHACLGGAREQFVVSGSEDGHIYIYHRATRTLLERLQGHEPCTVNSVAWHEAHPALFASCSDDHTVRIWRPAPGSGANVVRPRRREVLGDAAVLDEEGGASNGHAMGSEAGVSSPGGPNPFPWTLSPTRPTSELGAGADGGVGGRSGLGGGFGLALEEDEEIGEQEDDAQGEYDEEEEDEEDDSEDEDEEGDDEDEDRMEEA